MEVYSIPSPHFLPGWQILTRRAHAALKKVFSLRFTPFDCPIILGLHINLLFQVSTFSLSRRYIKLIATG